jgi:hypothetical protein
MLEQAITLVMYRYVQWYNHNKAETPAQTDSQCVLQHKVHVEKCEKA